MGRFVQSTVLVLAALLVLHAQCLAVCNLQPCHLEERQPASQPPCHQSKQAPGKDQPSGCSHESLAVAKPEPVSFDTPDLASISLVTVLALVPAQATIAGPLGRGFSPPAPTLSKTILRL